MRPRCGILLALLVLCSAGMSRPGEEAATGPAVAWGWFQRAPVGNGVRLFLVGPTTMKATDYLKEPLPPVELRVEGSFGSDTFVRSMRRQLYGRDRWFPWNEAACRLSQASVDPLSGELSTTETQFLLPALHPSPDYVQIHLGSGDELQAGDRSWWFFWERSGLFGLGEKERFLITPDLHAHVISPIPADLQTTGDVRYSAPMLLGGNPFVLDDKAPLRPKLNSVCRFQDEIFVAAEGGWVATIDVSDRPRWQRDLQRPFEKGNHVYFFAVGPMIHAIVSNAPGDEWRSYSSEDGNAWEAAEGLPLRPEEVPIHMGDRFLLASKEAEDGRSYRIWKRGSSAEWGQAATYTIARGEVVMDVLETETGRLLALTGLPEGKGLRVRVSEVLTRAPVEEPGVDGPKS